jgi:hypothetical protein
MIHGLFPWPSAHEGEPGPALGLGTGAMPLMWSERGLKAAATRRHSLCRCLARCARNARKGMTGGRVGGPGWLRWET